MDATITVIAEEGISAVTVRRIAATAGVNQALVSYHFDGLTGLLRAAYQRSTSKLVAEWETHFAQVQSFTELHRVGLDLAEQAKKDGSAAVLAQVIAAGFHDPHQAEAIGDALQLWRSATEAAILRVLAEHRFEDVVDPQQLAESVTAAVIGMLLLDCIEPAPLGNTLSTLAPMLKLVDRAARLIPAPLARRIMGTKNT